jgi:hypothetical protein
LSIWEIKAGSLEQESRGVALLEMLASAAPAGEVARAQSRLIASALHHARLSEAAQRMLATAHAVTAARRGATGLDWSVAIIGLCKAVEVEAVHRIAEPLRLAANDQDRPLAEGFLASLKDAVRDRQPFDPATRLPVTGQQATVGGVTWYDHARAYTDAKWPHLTPRPGI